MTAHRTIVAVGNSHLDAFLSAFDDWDNAPFRIVPVSQWDPALQPSWTVARGRVEYGDAFTAALRTAASAHPDAVAMCFWGSNAHFTASVLPKGALLDFVLPDRPDLPPDPALNLVPYDMVRDHMDGSIRPHAGLLSLTRELVSGPVFSVPPPPPMADTIRLRALLTGTLEPGLAARVRPNRIAPPGVRLKLWHVAVDVMRALSVEIGSRFLEPPGDIADAAGFLRDGLEADALHANAHYGRVLAEHVRTALIDMQER